MYGHKQAVTVHTTPKNYRSRPLIIQETENKQNFWARILLKGLTCRIIREGISIFITANDFAIFLND